FVSFMEKNPDIARGYSKGDKVTMEAKWQSLAEELNTAGPPIKDVGGWKKAWIDWRTSIKKKLSHNKKEVNATGGGPLNQMALSATENKVAEVCSLFKMVDGIEGARVFGPAVEQPNEEDAPLKRPADSSPAGESPPKRLRKSHPLSLEEAYSSQTMLMERVVESLDELNASVRAQTLMMAEHNAAILDIERQKLEALKNMFN
ncbi:hypothetical protein KR054_000942, partial [Drosophila jambulina]